MALVVKDRVKETTATTGTGTLTLAGAVTGFQSFSSALSNADTTYYAIFESSTGAWEVGLGTFTSSGTTLSRDTILESSNAGSAINLTAGAAEVFITQPAEKAVYLDANGYIFASDGRNLTNLNASNISSGTIGDAYLPASISSDITGNAATATKWATGRTISLTGDVTGTSSAFDGSGNLSFATTIAADSVALGTDTTGNYVATGAVSGNGLSGSASAEGATFTVTSNATNANTASTIVFRDASGNFSAGTITAALTGNASTASAWATGRTLSLTGDVTGTSASFDGSGNISIATTIAADSVALGTDTTGNYVATGAVSGNGLSGSASAEGATFTVTSNATNANTASTIVFRDASGNFSAGTITANLTGTASSATNADTVDSLHASQFIRSDADGTSSGTIAFGAGTLDPDSYTAYSGGFGTIADGSGWSARGVFIHGGGTGDAAALAVAGDTTYFGSQNGTAANTMSTIFSVPHSTKEVNFTTTPNVNGSVIWYAGNDGAGSGLDADTLDGVQGASYLRSDTSDTFTGTLTLTGSMNASGTVFAESLQEDYDALSGTTPTVDADNGGAFSLTTSGNTTFTFGAVTSGRSVAFILQLTAGGTHTITWPASVDWAGGSAPNAPASGETNIYVFWSRDGGTTWYGVLSSAAAA